MERKKREAKNENNQILEIASRFALYETASRSTPHAPLFTLHGKNGVITT
ncbi:MAG: hypothetical protein II400_02795 [Bacteroidaceae bacterium]|nr:hypothetical protein [Bacteroidaceae bacterium]